MSIITISRGSYSRGKEIAEKLAEKLFNEEAGRQVLASIVTCFFARKIFTPKKIEKAFRAVCGIELDKKKQFELGQKVLKMKYSEKAKLGFSLNDAFIPERIFETPSASGKLDRDYIKKAVRHFEKLYNS